MSERMPGLGSSEYTGVERDPLAEAKQTLEEIDGLLAKLNETGGELTNDQKQLIRNKVLSLLANIGLNEMSQLIEFTEMVHRGIAKRLKDPRTPSDYPSEENFESQLAIVRAENPRSHRPIAWNNPRPSEVAEFGHTKWNEVKGRGGKGLVEYHYDLGKLLCDELAYMQVFDENDKLLIGKSWEIENGRHRSLALRTLGEYFVRRAGTDNWLEIEVDQQS